MTFNAKDCIDAGGARLAEFDREAMKTEGWLIYADAAKAIILETLRHLEKPNEEMLDARSHESFTGNWYDLMLAEARRQVEEEG